MGGERVKEMDHFVASVETPRVQVNLPDIADTVAAMMSQGLHPITVNGACACVCVGVRVCASACVLSSLAVCLSVWSIWAIREPPPLIVALLPLPPAHFGVIA